MVEYSEKALERLEYDSFRRGNRYNPLDWKPKKPLTLKQISEIATRKILKWKSQKASSNWWLEEYLKSYNITGSARIETDYKYRDYFYYKLPNYIEEVGVNKFNIRPEYYLYK